MFDHVPDVAKPRPRAAGAFPPAAPGGNNQQLQNDCFDDEGAGVRVLHKLRLKFSDEPKRLPALNIEGTAIV